MHITTILFIPLYTQLEVELIVLSASTIFRTKLNTQSMFSDIHTSLGATIRDRFEKGETQDNHKENVRGTDISP